MAAKVCIGCGLTTNADGELIVDTNAAVWPYVCDQEDFGSPIYCGSDGALRAAPPVAIRSTVHKDVRLYTGNRALDDEPTERATDNYTVENPSECYPALWDFTVTLDFDFNIQPGARVRVTLDNDQVFDYTNRGTTVQNGLGWNVSVRKILPIAAGDDTTYTPSVMIWVTGTSAEITKLQQDIVGMIIAAPVSSSVSTGP